MGARGSVRGDTVLVVGAGLTGACLAWLAARAGDRVLLVSADRPASQTTSLVPGIVHGIGPAGGPDAWLAAGEAGLAADRERACGGHELLRDALFAARKATGYAICEHRQAVPRTDERDRVERAVAALAAAGFSVELEQAGDDLVVVRRRDAIIDTRALTFAILRLAAESGAEIRLGVACRGVIGEGDESVLVDLGRDRAMVRQIFWAGGSALPGERGSVRLRTRVVLLQSLAPASEPLGSILEASHGDLVLVPRPGREGAVLFRAAEDAPSGGLIWPELPAAWERYRGPALRQRLSEIVVNTPARSISRRGMLVSLAGLGGWPVAATLGACAEAIAEGRSASATA